MASTTAFRFIPPSLRETEMQIVNLSTHDTLLLAEAATRAVAEGRRFRVATDGDTFKYKVGEGSWTPPLYDQPDPYRDLS